MKFTLKKFFELTAKDFELHQIWGIYYEPEDIDNIVKLGYENDDIRRELKKVNYSDEYAFPIPNKFPYEPFKYVYFAINANLASGRQMKGYCSSLRAFAITLFHLDKKYSFNLSLKTRALFEQRKLQKALLSQEKVFPIQIEIIPLRRKGTFDIDFI